jgi:hypothetical protein
MTFHQQSFMSRMGSMGDESEGQFELTHPGKFVRFGLNRPPVNVRMLPPLIRAAPDYLTSFGFVECMGVGKDRILKLKISKALEMQRWHEIFKLQLFVWDSKDKRSDLFDWEWLWPQLPNFPTDKFSEGNVYWAVNIDELRLVP